MKKNIIILLFLALITSCKVTQKELRHVSHLPKSVNDAIDDVIVKENLKYNKVEITSNETGMGNMNYPKQSLRIIEVPNTKVFKQHNNLSEGRIVYKIPNVMKIRTTYKVLVRISKSRATVSIYDSLSGDVMTSRIPITETMEVKLIDVSPSDKKMFDIVGDDNGVQIVESGDTYTEWSWDVTPIHVGKTKLKIVISTIRNDNKKDIVYEDTVEIERDIKEQIIFFWEEYWKWIISTFMLPFALWFYKNRKNKKSKKDEEEETEEENETENEEEENG